MPKSKPTSTKLEIQLEFVKFIKALDGYKKLLLQDNQQNAVVIAAKILMGLLRSAIKEKQIKNENNEKVTKYSWSIPTLLLSRRAIDKTFKNLVLVTDADYKLVVKLQMFLETTPLPVPEKYRETANDALQERVAILTEKIDLYESEHHLGSNASDLLTAADYDTQVKQFKEKFKEQQETIGKIKEDLKTLLRNPSSLDSTVKSLQELQAQLKLSIAAHEPVRQALQNYQSNLNTRLVTVEKSKPSPQKKLQKEQLETELATTTKLTTQVTNLTAQTNVLVNRSLLILQKQSKAISATLEKRNTATLALEKLIIGLEKLVADSKGFMADFSKFLNKFLFGNNPDFDQHKLNFADGFLQQLKKLRLKPEDQSKPLEKYFSLLRQVKKANKFNDAHDKQNHDLRNSGDKLKNLLKETEQELQSKFTAKVS